MAATSDGNIFDRAYVSESRFGLWFQRTNMWKRYVLEEAIEELTSLLPPEPRSHGTVIDAGCGTGLAFGPLASRLGPNSIIGIDIDEASVRAAEKCRTAVPASVNVIWCDAIRMPVADACADLVFCHQLLHHANDAAKVLIEFRRVLKPGGWLLIAESCKSFIEWWPIRLLFRHPVHAQRTADGYVQLVLEAGFEIPRSGILTPEPFWSDPAAAIGIEGNGPKATRVPSQVRIAACRP